MNMETMHFDGYGSNTGLRTLRSVMIDDRLRQRKRKRCARLQPHDMIVRQGLELIDANPIY